MRLPDGDGFAEALARETEAHLEWWRRYLAKPLFRQEEVQPDEQPAIRTRRSPHE